jgi:ubiquinol-cytochrome c reductase cytochrome c1 subunit
MSNAMRHSIFTAALAVTLLFGGHADAAKGPGGAWTEWKAGNDISNIASLQRGAANFMGYCAGCHSIEYMRYSRLGQDLKIPEDQLEQLVILPGSKKGDYITTPLSAEDGAAWFGKAPPDLSLITRSKGSDYVYQFLKTFYIDPKSTNGSNNLALAGTSMPHVLSPLQGLQEATFTTGESPKWESFTLVEPGQLSAEEYDAFVRDTVNFLEYVGEPVKAKRQALGVWVILFLLVFTTFSYLLKREYWKDVK